MTSLPHRLDRTIVIRARPRTVFTFLTESARWAAWWGAGSSIDPRPGGRMYIRHANGVEVTGEVLDVAAPERIVFTYGYASGRPIPPDGSRVTIRLEADAEGTRLHLSHEFSEAEARDEHVQGWRFQLSLFANTIANAAAGDAASQVDRWFALWSDPDADSREGLLEGLVASTLRVADRYSCLDGIDEVKAHLAAVHRFMPGIRMTREGDVRHCQWKLLAEWTATGGGLSGAHGVTLLELDADGRIASITGFWPPAERGSAG